MSLAFFCLAVAIASAIASAGGDGPNYRQSHGVRGPDRDEAEKSLADKDWWLDIFKNHNATADAGGDGPNYRQSHGARGPERDEAEVLEIFKEWMKRFAKNYSSLAEKDRRLNIFKDKLRYIDYHNAGADVGIHSFRLGLNKFSDLTTDEFRAMHKCMNLSGRRLSPSNRYRLKAGETLPDSVDWRKEGSVTPVMYQGNCFSCWAISVVGAVEGINKIKTGVLLPLSVQELIDCDRIMNYGCNGGVLDEAYDYIIDNGIDTENAYPYFARNGKCSPYRRKIVTIDGFEQVPPYDQVALKKAVSNQPVSTNIDAFSQDFEQYQGGIFKGFCWNQLNHAVLIVGYGTEEGTDFWIIKNSWGTDWGEDGFMRIERNVGLPAGRCGIAKLAYYPIKEMGSFNQAESDAISEKIDPEYPDN